MFATITSLVIGLVILTVGGVIPPSTGNKWLAKLFLVTMGVATLIMTIWTLYDEAGKPIAFSTPGSYLFQLTEENSEEIRGIISIPVPVGGGGESVVKFITLPRRAFDNKEFPDMPPVKSLKIIETSGFKKITLKDLMDLSD